MGTMLLVTRRVRRDLGLLLTLLALVAFSTVLATAIPRLVVDTVDGGAREEVANAGPAADVQVRTPVGNSSASLPALSSAEVLEFGAAVPDRLPAGLTAVASEPVLTVLSSEFTVVTDLDVDKVLVRLGMVTPQLEQQLRVRSGSLPSAAAPGEPVEVVVAEDAGLPIGTHIRVRQLDRSVIDAFVVVGHVEPAGSPSDRLWLDLTDLWHPFVDTVRGTSTIEATLLAAPAGVDASFDVIAEQMVGTVRVGLDSDRFTAELVGVVRDDIGRLAVDSSAVRGDAATEVSVRSQFKQALAGFETKARGSVAQMSLMIAGVLGVCLVVVVLLSRLLVLRRAADIALQRARGATVLSIGLRHLLESGVIAVVGLAAGVLLGGAPADLTPLALLAAVAVLALPAQVMVLAASTWNRRRVQGDRFERADADRRRAAMRIAAEFAVVALAVAALAAIRSRGLLQTRSDGIDPLLAAAPLLLAAAIALAVLRVHPLVVRAVARVARRTRGVLGILGAVQAGRSVAVLPLLALSLSIGLVVSAGLLIETVRNGQVEASWQRVGADVRVDGPQQPDAAERLATTPGITAASLQLATGGTEAKAGLTTVIATTLAVDRHYAEVVAQLPDAPAGLDALERLVPASDDAPLPVLVGAEFADALSLGPINLSYRDDLITAEVVGTLEGGPAGYRNDPFFYVDLEALAARSSDSLVADTLLVMGPGAADLQFEGERTVRSEWLQDRQQQALVVGVERSMLVAAGAVALLAVIALVAGVQAGSRARARSLSLLRTLGLRARLGWWLALAELAPVVIAAVVGGILAGVIVVLVCAPSLGLTVLAGGLASPAPSISPWLPLGVAAGAVLLLGIAVLAELLAHRRDRLSEVLRVGETV